MVAVNPLVRAVITVTAFWGLILVGLAFVDAPKMFTTQDGLAFLVEYVDRGILYWLAGFVFTALIIILGAIANRMIRVRGLRGARLRGVSCTLGPVPLARSVLPMADLPDLTNAELFEYGPMIHAWMQKNRDRHPKHVAALEAVIRVLASRAWLPASHIPGGHGNRSLLDHSLRVGGMALLFAPTFEYVGLVSRYSTVPMRDPGFRLNAEDPMIPLVAVAHDIGKIATFLVEKGRVIGALPNHDLAGARMLALLDEVADLPPDDRNALLRAVAHYHHESSYPVAPDGRVERDRDVALMMLLIKSDNAAGKHEGEHFMTPEAYAQWLRAREESGDALDADEKRLLENMTAKMASSTPGAAAVGQQGVVAVISDEAVFSALQRILLAPGAISRNVRTRGDVIGQLNLSRPPQWAEDIIRDNGQFSAEQAEMLRQAMSRRIVIREDLLRKALSAALGITPTKRGDGRYDLSIRALEVLYAKGVLDNECSDGFVTPHSALFHLNWINRKSFQDIAMWHNAILLKPEGFLEAFATGDVHDSYYQIIRPVWKDRIVRRGGDAREMADDASGTQVNLDDAEEVFDRSAVLDETELAVEATASSGGASGHDIAPEVDQTSRADSDAIKNQINTQDAIQAMMRGDLSAIQGGAVGGRELHPESEAQASPGFIKSAEPTAESVPPLPKNLRPGAGGVRSGSRAQSEGSAEEPDSDVKRPADAGCDAPIRGDSSMTRQTDERVERSEDQGVTERTHEQHSEPAKPPSASVPSQRQGVVRSPYRPGAGTVRSGSRAQSEGSAEEPDSDVKRPADAGCDAPIRGDSSMTRQAGEQSPDVEKIDLLNIESMKPLPYAEAYAEAGDRLQQHGR